MRLEVFLPILISFPAGLLFFIALTRSVEGHLRSWKDKILFFFWPFSPYRMLVVQELDGEINIYYDDEFEEVRSEDRTLIKTVDGQQYVTEFPPSESSITVSMFDAKAPSGYYSPFAVGWRWVVAASVLVYFMYYALVVAWLPPIEIERVEFMGRILEIVRQTQLDPWEALIATTAFFVSLTWFLSNVMRMNDRTILYAWYHAKGINPPHISIVPVPGISNTSLLEYLEKLGRRVEIVVPSEVSTTIERALREVESKTGSRSLAAIILAKLAIARTWRQALAQVLRERFDMRKAGEASAMIRLGIQSISRKMVPVLLIVAMIAFVFGYLVGNMFTVSIVPAANTTAVSPQTIPPSSPPTPPAESPPPIKPAQPPPPPTG